MLSEAHAAVLCRHGERSGISDSYSRRSMVIGDRTPNRAVEYPRFPKTPVVPDDGAHREQPLREPGDESTRTTGRSEPRAESTEQISPASAQEPIAGPAD